MTSDSRRLISGCLCALGATALWSGNYIIARGLSENIPPVSLAFWRWTVAVIVFLPFALKTLLAERETLKANIRYLSVTALLGITVFNTLIYFAGHTTTALNLSLIAITFPVFILIFSRIFYREAITVNKSVSIVVVAAGIIILITKGDLERLLNISFAIGDIWMLAATLIFALYSILLKRRPERLSIWGFQLSTFILGLLFLAPFYIWETASGARVQWDATTMGSILYVGIFASLAAFVLWNKAIVLVGPYRAGMIYYTLPLFSGFLAYLFLGEAIGLMHFISAVLIVTGILAANYESKKA